MGQSGPNSFPTGRKKIRRIPNLSCDPRSRPRIVFVVTGKPYLLLSLAAIILLGDNPVDFFRRPRVQEIFPELDILEHTRKLRKGF